MLDVGEGRRGLVGSGEEVELVRRVLAVAAIIVVVVADAVRIAVMVWIVLVVGGRRSSVGEGMKDGG